MRVLCINAGSSSIKVSLYEVDETSRESDGQENEASAASSSSLPAGAKLLVSKSLKADEDPVQTLQHFVEQQRKDEEEHAKQSDEPHPHPIRMIAHRIVHGGNLFSQPTLLDDETTKKLESLNSLAPLHNPPALKWIHASHDAFVQPKQSDAKDKEQAQQQQEQADAHAVQVAVFDTSFFHDLPLPAQTYALPAELMKKHAIRRYGFHGIAHEFMLRSSPFASSGRVISLQLGSGCSAAAVLDGAPADTSMGFSPLPGLVMATRCGDVDGALLTFLQKHEPALARPEQLEDMLYHKAGLLGLTQGKSNDMQKIEEAAHASKQSDDKKQQQHPPSAEQLAIDVFAHQLLKTVGGYVAVLGGLDGLLFGGGIGEHSASVRARLVASLAKFLPMQLDEQANAEAGKNKQSQTLTRISTADSKIAVYVVAVDEAAFMLRDALHLHKTSKK